MNAKNYYIPLTFDLIPKVKSWSEKRLDIDLSKEKRLALICGKFSGNVEVIDIDLKYDITGTLYNRFKKAIKEIDDSILPLLTVQSTKSKGYHFIYRCEKIEGNLKLAQRYATEEEAKKGDKIKVLLETRGQGGYINCYPTEGYNVIYGSLDDIKTITPTQRDIIHTVARSFNEVENTVFLPPKISKSKIGSLTPFEDYNSRGDVISLLQNHGWVVVKQKGQKILFKRPGDTSALHSGNYDLNKNWFSVFSTSTQFDAQKAYQPYAVFAVLECNGDFSEASKKLYELGYGERNEVIRDKVAETKIGSRVSLTDDDLSFLATEHELKIYLESIRNGTFKEGATTGIKAFDFYFRFKEGNLVVINGHDNVGKSTVIWYLAMLSCLYNGWKWIIFSSENSEGGVVRKLMEFYLCESIKTMGSERYKLAFDFVTKNFKIIKTDEELYNYKDVLNMATKVIRTGEYKGLMIDPYNSLKIDLSNNSKLSTHEYHYEAISEMKLFGKKNKISIYVNCHAVTNALRQKDTDGMPSAPQKADTEGGGKFANKADEFITIHRKTQSETEWMVSDLHIRKVKETETGGAVTPLNNPFKLSYIKGGIGFQEHLTGFNPILAWHDSNKPKTKTTAIKPNLNFYEPKEYNYNDEPTNEEPF